MRLRFNLRHFLTQEGKTLIRSYQRLMARKQGIQLDPAPNNAPLTVLKKGKDHWMVDTGKLKKLGFQMQAWPMRLRVYASREVHSTKTSKKGGKTWTITHEELFLLHNQGHPGKRYSGVFNQLPMGSRFPERLSKAIYKQMIPQVRAELSKRIKVKI